MFCVSRHSRCLVGAAWLSSVKKAQDASQKIAPLPAHPSAPTAYRGDYAVEAQEPLLMSVVAQQKEDYKGVDVRNPGSVQKFGGFKPSALTLGDKVRAVSDFISGAIAHHVLSQDWVKLFDLKQLEMDVVYFLWIIHLHLISRRAASVPVTSWSHRRHVLDELFHSMQLSWDQTAESVMGRPPLTRIREFVKDMYYVVAIGLEEALSHEGPGGDFAILSVLMRLIPLPRPEDLPMYTYYAIVHYIRFHIALLDRTDDEMVLKGNFHFVSPLDPIIARPYDEVALDEVIRGWTVQQQQAEREANGSK